MLAGCATSGPGTQAAEPSAEENEEAMVNTGYGEQRRRDMTGAVGEVAVEDTRRARAPNFLSDLLEGSMAGVRVMKARGGGITVRIRGATSLYGSNAPLYVVDGVPVQPQPGGTLPWLNPADIASISVLKDASAAIYGSRGANGVIIITTN